MSAFIIQQNKIILKIQLFKNSSHFYVLGFGDYVPGSSFRGKLTLNQTFKVKFLSLLSQYFWEQ